MERLYRFKAIPEGTWVAVIAALMSVTGIFGPLFGATPEETTTAVGVVGTLSRLVIGAFKGDYTFKEAWEVGWAGLQAVSAIVAAVIAGWSDANSITIGGIVAVGAVLPRPFFAAILSVLTRQAGELPPLSSGRRRPDGPYVP